MKIETELNIGDIAYCVVGKNVHTTCEFCEGKGKVNVSGANGETRRVECPVCRGNGITETKYVHFVEDRKVAETVARVNWDNDVTIYYADLSGRSFIYGAGPEPRGQRVKSERAFRTKEEAQKYADMLDKEEK